VKVNGLAVVSHCAVEAFEYMVHQLEIYMLLFTCWMSMMTMIIGAGMRGCSSGLD
jgi:hypothetical protein